MTSETRRWIVRMKVYTDIRDAVHLMAFGDWNEGDDLLDRAAARARNSDLDVDEMSDEMRSVGMDVN